MGAIGAPATAWRDTLWIGALALVARLGVVIWAAERFPPVGDGVYYQRLAERIGAGLGSTWTWPDGTVTYAAHYPVGYPAALGALYAVFGAKPWVAMALNAALGALSAVAVHRLAARAMGRREACWAGGLVALHPGLVAYTPAIMTEGVTAALYACAAWAGAWAASARSPGWPGWAGGMIGTGAILGVATLVRPQSIALAPLFGLLVAAHRFADEPRAPRRRRDLWAIAIVTAVALLVCAPWTARNCVSMKQCGLVSFNGGWNLLIGADRESTGTWAPIKVPAACREVFDEAEKDACFGREARRFIASHPAAWIALAPSKLAATFDYAGGPGWYLHASNPEVFGERAKIGLGAAETLFERAVLLLALLAIGRRAGPGEPRWLGLGRRGVAGVGAIFVFTVHAWVGYLAFGVAWLLRGRALGRGPFLVDAAASVVLATAGVHAIFFGAGRYSMVVFPLLSGVAALAFRRDFSEDPEKKVA
jgi:hypothetical protein